MWNILNNQLARQIDSQSRSLRISLVISSQRSLNSASRTSFFSLGICAGGERGLAYLELHLGELVELLVELGVDKSPGDLLLALALGDHLLGLLVEGHDALHHAQGLGV